MKCIHCNEPNKCNAITCGNPECNKPVYSLELLTRQVFLGRPLELVIVVKNNGPDPVLPEQLRAAGHVISLHNPEEITSGESRDFTIVLPEDSPVGRHELHLICWFRGNQISLPHASNTSTFDVLLSPSIEVHGLDTIEVKPSDNYTVQASITLTNAPPSSCEHINIVIKVNAVEVVGQAQHDTTLDSDTTNCTFAFKFPAMEPGETTANIRIHGSTSGNLLYEATVPLYVYVPPALKIEYGFWGKENFEYAVASSTKGIQWRAPTEEIVSKRLRISLNDDDHDYSESDGDVSLNADIINFATSEYIFAGEMTVDTKLGQYKGEKISTGQRSWEKGTLDVTLSGIKENLSINLDRFVIQKNASPLCLDFGTSNCCTALIRPDEEGHPHCLSTIPMDYEAPTWLLKSAVDQENGQFIFGKDVLDMDETHPLFKHHPIKQKMFEFNSSEEDRKQSAKLASELMLCCFQRAQQWLTDQPNNARILFEDIVLTVPTSFPQRWKTELVDIARKVAESVFGVVKVFEVDEATAVLRYMLENKNTEVADFKSYDIVAVCDFGGGSTDVVILQNLGTVNNKPSYEVLSLGGIPNFGSTNLNQVISLTLKDKVNDIVIEQHIAERLKKHLNDRDKFMDCLKEDVSITSLNLRDVLFKKCTEAIQETLSYKLESCFPDLLERVSRKYEAAGNPKVLLLLAGQGAKLDGFESQVKTAWVKASKKIGIPFASPVMIMMQEPKRCVALGGFLSHGKTGRLTGIGNFIPQDFLVEMDNEFSPEDQTKLITLNDQLYYRVFEAGEKLDENDEAQVAIPLADLDRSYEEMLTLKLYSSLPGGGAMYMQNFSKRPPEIGFEDLTGKLTFVYKAEGAKIAVDYI